MKNPTLRFFVVLGTLALLGLLLKFVQQEPADGPMTRMEGNTMGTYYVVQLAGVDLSPADAQRVHALIDAELLAVNEAMSTYMPESEISRFNRHRDPTPFPISFRFREVMERAFDLYEDLSGTFDPTVGPLVNLWGFGERGGILRQPDPDALSAARELVGLSRLITLTDEGLVKSDPEVQLNLSAIAKGYGVDRVLRLLLDLGFVNVHVEIGGDLAVRGRNAGGLPWRIGIQLPERDQEGELMLVLGVEHGAMATSGDYQNFIDLPEGHVHHILDPRTGHPVASSLASVTIIAPDCMTADAIATGLFVKGAEAGLAWVERHPGIEALFIERGPHGDFRTRVSEGFRRFVVLGDL